MVSGMQIWEAKQHCGLGWCHSALQTKGTGPQAGGPVKGCSGAWGILGVAGGGRTEPCGGPRRASGSAACGSLLVWTEGLARRAGGCRAAGEKRRGPEGRTAGPSVSSRGDVEPSVLRVC